ncbi:hypothetical protein B5M44_12715 [Shinella sumterensis]|uniref:hypothetical protein n=1 Tax=Shinella sumterensis TaxID=1967501 RepID=UPI00106EAC6F|nr:hypothetical protein [Shinella sumterensis]MCD1265999.1 hypothetical protein [Shinella sumterensis]TFE97811.1 hypothetical protein B5M44_12715 [Shinella sumterensis]
MRAEAARTVSERSRLAQERQPIPFIDEFGQRCLRVPLDSKRKRYAVIDEASYQRATAGRATGVWFLNDNGHGNSYVRCWSLASATGKPTLVQVARLITDAGRGKIVRYANGDRLDLRASNLRSRRGSAKRCDGQIATISEMEVAI